MKVITSIAVGLLAAWPLAAQQAPTVVARGQGSVSLAPSHAQVHFTVESRARTAAEAAAENDTKAAALLDQLRGLDRALDSVKVTSVSLHPTEDRQRREITGYLASATVSLLVRDLARLAEVYDVAIGAGVSRLGQISFMSDSTEAARAQAIAAAFENAKADAAALAAAAGASLARIVTVGIDGPGAMPTRVFSQAAAMDMVENIVTVAPDPQDVVVTAAVSVTWELTVE